MIELENVHYSYGERALLRGVTLDLEAGSFHFLTGPSGAGKTTLMRLCVGELLPKSGRISLFGQNAESLSRDDMARMRRRVGVVHQEARFLDHLSVLENIAMPLVVSGQDPEAHRDDLTELIKWVGLRARAEALPAELSGGERQRAALARAIIQSPDVILADEPTGNIDWDMSLRLMELLVALNQMGKTVLLATHDLGLIRAARSGVQARVLRLSKGQLQIAGSEL